MLAMGRAMSRHTAHLLDDLLAEQARVISRQQLIDAGASCTYGLTRVESGRWQRAYPGTYVAHSGELSYLSRVWSALLYAGKGAIASYETAAYLHDLLDRPPGEVHVTIASNRRVAAQPELVVHITSRARVQAQPLPTPPRTTVEETVLDITSAKKRPDDVVAVLTGACQRRKTTAARLGTALALRKKMPHRALIEETLAAIGDGVQSVLEWRYRRDVEQRHGLPTAKRQSLRRRTGKREFLDVDYEEYGVVVELDGEAHHDFEQRARDRARDRAALTRGEVTLRYTWRDVTLRPCETAAEVAAVLALRGWRGRWRRCQRCGNSSGDRERKVALEPIFLSRS